jgi:hypothetical protein
MTLFGRGLEYLPYALVGLQDFGGAGIGHRGPAGAGRFRLERVEAWNPLTRARSPVYGRPRTGQGRGGTDGTSTTDMNGSTVRMPAVPVTHADVLARAARWLGRERLTLRLLTPLRLAKDPVRRIAPAFLLRRLVDRLEALALRYGAPGAATPLGAAGAAALGTIAGGVRMLDDHTRWVEVQSFSSRQQQLTPLGGLVGEITLGAEPARLAALLPWLVWGEQTHAGKEVTRGNGWYQLIEP